MFHVPVDKIRQNICRLFNVLAQTLLTTSKVDYYHQKVKVRVASRLTERLTDRVFEDRKFIGNH